ncbi:NfrA family protein [Chitinibacteraceae bacterium HSL-7]
MMNRTLQCIAASVFMTLVMPAHAGWLSSEWQSFRSYPRLQRAYDLFTSGDAAAARPYAEEAERINPGHRETRVLLMRICQQLDDLACLEREGSDWIKRKPDDGLGYIAHAYVAYQRKQFARTSTLAPEALKRGGLSRSTQAQVGALWVEALLNQGRHQSAEIVIDRLSPVLFKQSGIDVSRWRSEIAQARAQAQPSSLEGILEQRVPDPHPGEVEVSASKEPPPSSSAQQIATAPRVYPWTTLPAKDRQREVEALLYAQASSGRFDVMVETIVDLTRRRLATPAMTDYAVRAMPSSACANVLDLISPDMDRVEAKTQAAAGYCAPPEQAALHFAKANAINRVRHQPVDRAWLVAEGQSLAESGKTDEALERWEEALRMSEDLALERNATQLALNVETTRSRQFVKQHSHALPAGVYATHQAREAALSGDRNTAKAAYQRAMNASSSIDLQAEYARFLAVEMDPEAAMVYRDIVTRPEAGAQLQAEGGYLFKHDGDAVAAQRAFEQALALDPERAELRPELAMLASDAGHSEVASTYWQQSIDTMPEIAQRTERTPEQTDRDQYAYRRANQQLEDRVSGFAGVVIRLDRGPQSGDVTSPVQYAQYGGYYFGELSYRVDPIVEPRLPSYVYVRAMRGIEDRSLAVNDDALVTGLGVRQRLLSRYAVFASAEWLHQSKDTANQLMLRLTGSHTEGSDWNPVESSWRYINLYGDLAWTSSRPTTFATLQGEWGQHFRIPGLAKVTWMPYLVSSVAANNDNDDGSTISRFDTGFGVAIWSWHREGPYRAPSFQNRLSLEARKVLGGNTEDRHTVMLKWSVSHF